MNLQISEYDRRRPSPLPKGTSRLATGFVLFLLTVSAVLSLEGADPPVKAAQWGGEVNLITRCLDGSIALPRANIRAAFLVPTFTLTPYVNFNNSFYAFYLKYKTAPLRITTDLKWLQTHAIENWTYQELLGESQFYDFLKSQAATRCGLVLGQNVLLTNDERVDGGTLFTGGLRNYDVLILGHEEYVTKTEYAQLKAFVATGGRIVEMSGNTFWGEVNYSRTTHLETFVAGHGFEFNGKYAWTTDYEPFDLDSAGWFGSTFANGIWVLSGAQIAKEGPYGSALSAAVHGDLAFTTYSYPHDEVNYVRNKTETEVIAKFYVRAEASKSNEIFWYPPVPVYSYSHTYRKGEIVCLCVFGEDIIGKDEGVKFFMLFATLNGFMPQPPSHPPYVPIAARVRYARKL
jgi:hypothetical protein